MVYVGEGEISYDITSLSPVCRSGAFLYEGNWLLNALSSQPFQLPNPISLPMVQGVLTIGEAFALALVSFPPDPKAGS